LPSCRGTASGFQGKEGLDITGAYTMQIGGTFHGKGGTNVQFDGMGIQHAFGNQGYNANAGGSDATRGLTPSPRGLL
jgi:hypothetical protein